VSYLLDTNVISEVGKGTRASLPVVRWFDLVDSRDLYISVIVVAEVRRGIEMLRSKDPLQAHARELWLGMLLVDFDERIIPISVTVAEAWGRMNAIRTLPVLDGLMAATAKSTGLTMVTRNVRHFEGVGLHLINPFERIVPDDA
jgi:predicted nucleic acid-binding protein